MERSGDKKTQLWQISHVGLMVKDVDKAVAFLSSIGMGPFENTRPQPVFIERIFRGRSVKGKAKTVSGKIGTLRIEISQQLEGESPGQEFFDKTGGGIHHLGLLVSDFEKEKANLIKNGCRLVAILKEGGPSAHFEHDSLPGVDIELQDK